MSGATSVFCGAWTLAASLVGCALVGCSLVVDTEALTAGREGLVCAETEKVCPVESDSELYECVSRQEPTKGCGEEACTPCARPGAVARCNSKDECAIAICSGTNQNCDGEDENGCEVDTATSLDNCGACGRACAFDGAIAECVRGVCTFVVCSPPFADCDGKSQNGCETNTHESTAHCGGCGESCDGTCEDGECSSG